MATRNLKGIGRAALSAASVGVERLWWMDFNANPGGVVIVLGVEPELKIGLFSLVDIFIDIDSRLSDCCWRNGGYHIKPVESNTASREDLAYAAHEFMQRWHPEYIYDKERTAS